VNVWVVVGAVLVALVLALAVGLWAQGVPPPINTAPAVSAAEHAAAAPASYRVDWIILGAACLGAFLGQRATPGKAALSMETVYYVLVTGGVTYLALQSGIFPDSIFRAAVTNPVQTGVVAFVAAGLGGGGLVKGAQGLLASWLTAKGPTAPPS
jgi:hypothetical protein